MRAVTNALALIEAVVDVGPGVSARELSSRLRLAPASTYRLLNHLVAEEYLVRLPDLHGFALGKRAGGLSPQVPPRPPAAAREAVAALRDRTRWGVHLAALSGPGITITDPDPDHPPCDQQILAAFPHASAIGRLMLAEQPDWRAVVRDLRPRTDRTLTDPDLLDRVLADTARTGLARQCAELRPDRGCIAVPVRATATGALIAALAVSGPADRIAEPNEDLLAELRECAGRLAPLLA
jgi:DNA-binding IclR family transcriptional regulator